MTDLAVGFDDASVSLTLTPLHGWTLGEFYWVGVRGYANGVRDAGGRRGGWLADDGALEAGRRRSPATPPIRPPIDPHCPAFEVLAQGSPSPEAAAARLFQLEEIRTAYRRRARLRRHGGGRACPRRRSPCCGASRSTPTRSPCSSRAPARFRACRPPTRSWSACRGRSIRRPSPPSSPVGSTGPVVVDGPDRRGRGRSRRRLPACHRRLRARLLGAIAIQASQPFPARAPDRALLHERASIRPTARRWSRRPCRCC